MPGYRRYKRYGFGRTRFKRRRLSLGRTRFTKMSALRRRYRRSRRVLRRRGKTLAVARNGYAVIKRWDAATWSGKTCFVRLKNAINFEALTTVPNGYFLNIGITVGGVVATTTSVNGFGALGGINSGYVNHPNFFLATLVSTFNSVILGNATGAMMGAWTRGLVRWMKIRLRFVPTDSTVDPNMYLYAGAVTTDITVSGPQWMETTRLIPGFKVRHNWNRFIGGGATNYNNTLSIKKTIILRNYDSKYALDPQSDQYGFTINNIGDVTIGPPKAVCYAAMGLGRQNTTAFPAGTTIGHFYLQLTAGISLFRPRITVQQ